AGDLANKVVEKGVLTWPWFLSAASICLGIVVGVTHVLLSLSVSELSEPLYRSCSACWQEPGSSSATANSWIGFLTVATSGCRWPRRRTRAGPACPRSPCAAWTMSSECRTWCLGFPSLCPTRGWDRLPLARLA